MSIEEIRKAIFQRIERSVNEEIAELRGELPVKTGVLKESIKITKEDNGSEIKYSIRANAPYASFVPKARVSFDNSMKRLDEKIKGAY
jgi:hypothetical protein